MNFKCGLVNKENSCRCPKKTKGFIANGWVTPGSLKWNSDYTARINELVKSTMSDTVATVDELYARLYREHPFKIQPKADDIVQAIINNRVTIA